MTREPGARIGVGGSAEVFAYGDDAVLKLFRPRYAFAVDREAERTRAVHAAGIPAPRVIDIVVVDGRRGLVLERIEGRTLLEDLVAGRCGAHTAGAMTAEVQTAVHRATADLPRLADVARRAALPDGDAVAHLDLHPGNVMGSPQGPVVIDWVNAHLAPAAADVARSVMTIRYQGLGRLGAGGGVDEERRVREQWVWTPPSTSLDEWSPSTYVDSVAEATELAQAAGSKDPAVGLRAVSALRRLLEQLEALQVASARAAGWSWQDIASALGVTKQAAHQKHGRR